MIITVLEQKYLCGCNRGIAQTVSSGLLKSLNNIIDWKHCTWPVKVKDEVSEKVNINVNTDDLVSLSENKDNFEFDTKFLGDVPELKPGDCFGYKGNVIAVENEDTLILVITETGSGALNRIFEDYIKLEARLKSRIPNVKSLETSVVEFIPGNYKNINIDYNKLVTFRDGYLFVNSMDKRVTLKVILETTNSLFNPITVYFSGNKFYYDEDVIPFSEMATEILDDVIAFVINY